MTTPLSRLARYVPPESTTAGYLLRLSRPRFWFYLAGPVVVGVAYAAGTAVALFAPVAVALFAYFLVPANVYLYGVNDVFDRDVDAVNPKKDDREVRYAGDRLVPVLVAACGLAGAAFLPFLPGPAALAMVGFLPLGAAYSAPPLRFKTTPLLDSVSNGLYVLPGVCAYATLSGTWPPLAAVVGGWLWTMGMHTFSAIPDIEPDRTAGIRTTATALGERWAYWDCAGVWTLAALAFLVVHPALGALLAGYPPFALWVGRSSVSVDRAYWWFPAVNVAAGTCLTLGGLWVLLHG
jgi:4-hydroxybenzoate polyprenyltransferase